MMHGHEKSDPAIVAMKPANKAARSATEPSVKEPAAAESVEQRAGTKGNADWQSTRRTQRRVSVAQALERIRQVGARLLCRLDPRWEPYAGKLQVRNCAGGARQLASLPRLRRRDFISLLGGAAAWPLAAWAQQPGRIRQIGFLGGGGIETDPVSQADFAPLREGLAKLGWIEGRNLQIDRRYGGGDPNRIRFFADELVSLAPEVMVVSGGPATLAVQHATRTIPIVFVSVGDPVDNGFVSNIARPDGNTTGFTNKSTALSGKWRELLKEAAPQLVRIALVYDPETSSPGTVSEWMEAEAAQRDLSVTRILFRDSLELVRGIDAFAAEPGGGLVIASGSATEAHRSTIIRLAAQHRLPAIYPYRFYAAEGGLIAYGPDRRDLYSSASSYVDRLLRGARVSDLPVQFPAKLELIINLKTAKALGLTVPPSVLARADEVIE